MQRAPAHTWTRNRMGYPILPPLLPPFQHSSPGKQRAPNIASYWRVGRTLSLMLITQKMLFPKILSSREQTTQMAWTKEEKKSPEVTSAASLAPSALTLSLQPPPAEEWQMHGVLPGCCLLYVPGIKGRRAAQSTQGILRPIWLNS